MKFKSIFIVVFSVFAMISCSEKKSNTNSKSNSKSGESVAMVTSFVTARNSFDTEKLRELTTPTYQELFKNDFAEVKSQEQLLANQDWAKEMSSVTKIKKVVSENDSIVVVIEESTNYIDVALKRKPQNYETTYYLKDGKILKQSFDFAPNEKFDQRANDVLYGNFERFCKVRDIDFSWEPTKEAGKILRKALETYANRVE
ncbi:hypothetical protein KORDIASMS9_02098 [Kordia sp. SMS9]|uniref:hypothetical protein n=1 Tax=Kordia sp. SMS9 TaxID=2282170 RepID=UPI000E10D8C3|nr:hypothetical protein [Kordia sp. SMS9]AXG69870.1 hypothetical protein KORDIASMS9_02098 [Kordia sp. SMS9]